MTGGTILTDEVIRQILAIRETGKTNMFDVVTVDKMARRKKFWALQRVLRENKSDYAAFIMFGKVV